MRTRAAIAILTAVLAFPCGVATHEAAAAPTGASAALTACGSNLRTWFVPEGDGYAGGAGYVVEFSNVGRTTCTVEGYPTVWLTENRSQVGLKSNHDPLVPIKTVRLKPGKTAHVVLFITDAGALCRPLKTNGLSVKPPGSTPATNFPLVAFGACAGKSTLRVDAINRGVGIPYYTIR